MGLTTVYGMRINDFMQKLSISVIGGVIVTLITAVPKMGLEQVAKWVYNKFISPFLFDTSDGHAAKEPLEKVKKNLNNCLEVCDQIEKQSRTGNVLGDIQRVQELASTNNTGMQVDLRPIETAAHNPNSGLYQLQPYAVQNTPEKVEMPIVQENKPGMLWVKWNQIEADYYELQYDRQTGYILKVSSTEWLLDSMQLHFRSKNFYSIRVRGVNGRGPGEWSESAVGSLTSLPEQPQEPLAVHVNSSTDVSLIVEKPTEREDLKPITHFVVEYHTPKDTKWTKQAFLVNELDGLSFNGRSAVIINLKWSVDIASTYHLQISHRNEDGDSLPHECTIKILPGDPVEPSVVFQNTDTIIIKWKKPETNAYTVDHYEVHWGMNEHTMQAKTTKNCYAVIRFLEPGRRYLFKVRSVNKEFYKGKFTEISAKTSYMTWNVAKVVAAGIVGALFFDLHAYVLLVEAIHFVKLADKKTTCSQIIKSYGVLTAVIAVIGIVFGICIGPLATIRVIGAGIGIALMSEKSEKDLKRHLSLFPDDNVHFEQENLNEQNDVKSSVAICFCSAIISSSLLLFMYENNMMIHDNVIIKASYQIKRLVT